MNVVAHVHHLNSFFDSSGAKKKSADAYLLIVHLLEELKRCTFVDDYCLWTRSEAISDAGQKLGYVSMPYGLDFFNLPPSCPNIDQWDQGTLSTVKNKIGYEGDVRLYLQTDHLMLSTLIFEKMYDQLMEDDQAHVVFPVYRIDPHIYMKSERPDDYFPVWEYPGLDRQKYPQLYRKAAAFVWHPGRLRYKQPAKEAHFVVPWHQGKTYLNDMDIEFAKYMRSKKKEDRQ